MYNVCGCVCVLHVHVHNYVCVFLPLVCPNLVSHTVTSFAHLSVFGTIHFKMQENLLFASGMGVTRLSSLQGTGE